MVDREHVFSIARVGSLELRRIAGAIRGTIFYRLEDLNPAHRVVITMTDAEFCELMGGAFIRLLDAARRTLEERDR